jgi:hypothetical protein
VYKQAAKIHNVRMAIRKNMYILLGLRALFAYLCTQGKDLLSSDDEITKGRKGKTRQVSDSSNDSDVGRGRAGSDVDRASAGSDVGLGGARRETAEGEDQNDESSSSQRSK